MNNARPGEGSWGYFDFIHPWINPRAEMRPVDYHLQNAKTLAELRMMLTGYNIQLAFLTTPLYIFCWQIVQILKIIRNCRNMSIYLCLLQACAGIASVFGYLLAIFPNGPSCRASLWCAVICTAIYTLCYYGILFEKAYVISGRKNYFLILWLLFCASTCSFVYTSIWLSYADITVVGSCISIYWPHNALVRPFTIIFANLVLSTYFIRVVMRQYRLRGTSAWEYLSNDGIITMLIILVTSTTSSIIIVTNALGFLTTTVFMIDCKY
jgi:hypothetical protein